MTAWPWTRAEVAVLSPDERLRVAGEAIDYVADRLQCFECCGRGFVIVRTNDHDGTYHHCSRCGGEGVEL